MGKEVTGHTPQGELLVGAQQNLGAQQVYEE
jgi:hypothetical protein